MLTKHINIFPRPLLFIFNHTKCTVIFDVKIGTKEFFRHLETRLKVPKLAVPPQLTHDHINDPIAKIGSIFWEISESPGLLQKLRIHHTHMAVALC